MDAERFFKDLYYLANSLKRCGVDLQEAEIQAAGIRSPRLGMGGTAGRNFRISRVEAGIEETERRREALENVRGQWREHWEKLEAVKDQFSSPILWSVAVMRYKYATPWADICREINYSRRYCMHINRTLKEEAAALIP